MLAGCEQPPIGAAVGDRLPELPLADATGASAPLPSGWTAVFVWAPWCRPCEPAARALAAEPPPPGLAVAPLALTGPPVVAAALSDAWGLPAPLRFAPPEGLLDAWAIDGLPTVLLVDDRGVLRMRGDDWTATRRVAAELLAHDH